MSQDSVLDWQTRRSDALLELRKRHLQELAQHATESNVPECVKEAQVGCVEENQYDKQYGF